MTRDRGRLAAYGLYQLRDFMMERGAYCAIIAALMGWTFLLDLRSQFGPEWRLRPDAAQLSADTLQSVFKQAAFLLVLLASTGVIANDRKQGYYRLFFAKPVSITRYYFQAWIIAAIGFLAVIAFLSGVWALVAAPFAISHVGRILAFTGSYFILLGGMAFLMSSLVRFDWVATASLWGVAGILNAVWGERRDVLGWIAHNVFPPASALDAVQKSIFLHGTVDGVEIARVAGYGLACVIAGLIVLRVRPLGR